MLNVHELERRWLRYKIRQYLPYGVGAAALLLILIVVSVWTFSDDEVESTAPVAVAETPVQPQPQQQTSPQPASTQQIQPQAGKAASAVPPAVLPNITPAKAPAPVTVETVPAITEPQAKASEPADTNHPQNNKVVLKPSFDFLKTIERAPAAPKPSAAPKPKTPKRVATAPVEEVYAIPDEPAPQRDQNIKINRKFSQQEIDDAVDRFKKRKSPALGLFLSRHFYDTGDYEQAYNYALQTNRIDSRSEESWMIFAKAQYKLGQKKNAIKTLRAYVQQSGSAKAHMLLNTMQNGNFQ